MDEKILVITGASDGIGAEAAAALSGRGAVVVVGRSPQKTRAVAERIGAAHYVADFASLHEVRQLALALRAAYPAIHVLANNAGGILAARELTIDGHEKTLQVNHLAGFLLTMLLMDSLIAGRATVINTSSVAHRVMSRFDIDDLELAKRYSPSIAYGNTKLMNILFAKELDHRFGEKGISAVAFHPGIVATGFSAGSTSPLRLLYHQPLRRLLGLATPHDGADTLVWLATGRPGIDWQPGGYYVRRRPAATSAAARDRALAERLWADSERMVAQFLGNR